MKSIRLVDVYTQQAESMVATVFLYDLLAEREPDQSISHREMPSFEEHQRFVDSRPYREWFIVFHECEGDGYGMLSNIPIGAIYLSEQNEIGISILKAYRGHGYGPLAVCMLMNLHPDEQFLANINPNNGRSIVMFEELGFEMLQVTYIKRPSHDFEDEDITDFALGSAGPR